MLYGHHPYVEFNSNLVVLSKIIEGVRPKKPEATSLGFSDELWRTVELCWLGDRDKRPAVEYVLGSLNYAAALWRS